MFEGLGSHKMSVLVLNGAESVKSLKIMKQAKLIDSWGSPYVKILIILLNLPY